ncbi:MAG: magnesium transporter CorA family protein [Gammaproteobacteria bacterium]
MPVYLIDESIHERIEPPAGDVNGLLWFDLERDSPGLSETLRSIPGVNIDERHLVDLANPEHPPFSDITDDYELLIVRTPKAGDPDIAPATEPVAFITSNKILISVRPKGHPVFEGAKKRLLGRRRALPASIVDLMALLLNDVGDRLLALRDPIFDKLDEWQNALLDDKSDFQEWTEVLKLRRALRRLSSFTGNSLDALDRWRAELDQELSQAQVVRLNDVSEHFGRFSRQAAGLNEDLSALIQVHFSVSGQRTNSVMQVLAVISAIFLPLNLVASMFGMNFENLPLIKWEWGFALAMTAMVLSAGVTLWWFRRLRWF